MLLLIAFTLESVCLNSNPDSKNYCCVTLGPTSGLNSFMYNMRIKKYLIESLPGLNEMS